MDCHLLYDSIHLDNEYEVNCNIESRNLFSPDIVGEWDISIPERIRGDKGGMTGEFSTPQGVKKSAKDWFSIEAGGNMFPMMDPCLPLLSTTPISGFFKLLDISPNDRQHAGDFASLGSVEFSFTLENFSMCK